MINRSGISATALEMRNGGCRPSRREARNRALAENKAWPMHNKRLENLMALIGRHGENMTEARWENRPAANRSPIAITAKLVWRKPAGIKNEPFGGKMSMACRCERAEAGDRRCTQRNVCSAW